MSVSNKRRAAIYARFSTDLQNDRSVDDQIELCRAHAARQGFFVVATFSDSAKSGASMIGRSGVLDLLAAAKVGEFDIVIVEALDRLSRDQEDLAHVYKRLKFGGVSIEAVHDGRADDVQIGVRGLLGSLFLADLAHKTRRGMEGVVRDGRSAGGKAYGYSTVKGEPGVIVVNEAEAEIVRRIFAEYVAGKRPRKIAYDLNRDGIPPPRSGGAWNASTINGNMQRGCGILQNQIYIGRLVWNRVRMIRDPDTGKRVSRPNPESEWKITERPDLAIVDLPVWNAAQARKIENQHAIDVGAKQHRSPHAFSSLLRCAACGSGMTINGRKKGHSMIQCSRARESGSCHVKKYIRLDKIERTVLASLRDELSDEGTVAMFVAEYRREWKRLADEANREKAAAERELSSVEAGIVRLADAMAAGIMTQEDVKPRYDALVARRQEIAVRIAMAGCDVPEVKIRENAVARLRAAVQAADSNLLALRDGHEVREALREVIAQIKVFTDPFLAIQIVVRSAAVLEGTPLVPEPSQVTHSVVAGPGIFAICGATYIHLSEIRAA